MELKTTGTTSIENPILDDLYLDGGRLVFTSDLGAEVAQRLRVRFNFWRTEWFLNLDAGTPYLEVIFEKGVSDNAIRSVFSQIILGTKGVAALDALDFTTENRQLSLTFVCRLVNSTTFRSTSYGPFVISLGQQ